MVDRIVSLLPAATEVLFALGVGGKVQAVSHSCDHPPEVDQLPRATRTGLDTQGSSRAIDEAVRATQEDGEPLYEVLEEVLHHAQPDLIVTQDACSVCGVTPVDVEAAMARIEPVQRPETVTLHPHTLEDVIEDVRRLGRATGATERGAKLADELTARVDAVQEHAARADGTPSAAVLDWLDPPMAAGHWIPGMVETAGGRPLLVTGTDPSTYVEFSDVVEADPEVLVLAPCGFGLERTRKAARHLMELDGWSEITAVQAGHVWAMDASAYTARPGPRLVDGLEQLAVALHPDALADTYPAQAERIERLS